MSELLRNEMGAPTALGHLQVVELGSIASAYCAKYLAGLGADVIKVEPPGGDPNRHRGPFAGDIGDLERSIPFLNANIGKRSIVLDLDEGRDLDVFKDLLKHADLFIDGTVPGELASLGLSNEDLFHLNQGLVRVSLTPFGQSGPYKDYLANDAIISAMSGLSASQGDDAFPPVMPPTEIGTQLAGIHGAYLGLAGIRHVRRTGQGQHIDLSLQEALTYTGSAAVARYSQRSEIVLRPGNRGGAANIYKCKDGKYIMLAIFFATHWSVLTKEWMQDPILSEPDWDNAQYRTDNQDIAQVLIGDFISKFTSEEFIKACQERGIACGPVNTLEGFINSEHMDARSWFSESTHPVVGTYQIAGAPFNMGLTPYRFGRPAPLLDQHRSEILEGLRGKVPHEKNLEELAGGADQHAPMLDGVRLADITRVFVGPIGTMFLGYYGAQVVKVESADLTVNRDPDRPLYPDMNRNKLSSTIDLRNDQGKDLMKRLIKESDILVENFSASVMGRLGFGYTDVVEIKSDIIQVGMPGMGSTGPLSSWVSYGNQLQGYTGLSHLWGYKDSPMDAHAKGVLPDFVGAAFFALGSLAAIEYRDQTGHGQFIENCMIDGMGSLLGPAILDYTINQRAWDASGYSDPMRGMSAPFGAYPCNAPDTWIVIACESDDQWRKLVEILGQPAWVQDERFFDAAARKNNEDVLNQLISEWTQEFTPFQAMRILQAGGVPAGVIMNSEDLYSDMHLRSRGHIVDVNQPPWGELAHQGLPGIPSLSRADAIGPTPWIGDDNTFVFQNIIGLSPEELMAAVESGAIR